ncbi:hypothetical protein BXY51_003379 [Actinoplanes cyaneus]|nr:hypothetical protein [Actinoplanes cyaneus]
MAINVVLDGILLIFFTAFSYGMDALLHYFDLEGVSATARDAISVIFAIGTIGFALLMMIADLIEIAKELFG